MRGNPTPCLGILSNQFFSHLIINFFWIFASEIQKIFCCLNFYIKETNWMGEKTGKKELEKLTELEKHFKKKKKNQNFEKCIKKMSQNVWKNKYTEKNCFSFFLKNIKKKSLELKKFERVYRKKLGVSFFKYGKSILIIFSFSKDSPKLESEIFEATRNINGSWVIRKEISPTNRKGEPFGLESQFNLRKVIIKLRTLNKFSKN
mmetsp:Transcript_3586/g.7417  ORF Transcript_3586/g.7417 Transcript_3586/m.7417 type:complete len:204 (+) Transcript_3586:2872-3483(+)